jgi:endonuclease YncB( thermonuclease family)
VQILGGKMTQVETLYVDRGPMDGVRIIAPDAPEPEDVRDLLEAEVTTVFDGDGFLAKLWQPLRGTWLERVPFRFAFIDAPEMQQPFGREAQDFLHQTILGKNLKLSLIGKQSTGYMPIDGYRRLLCVGFLTEEMQSGEVRYFRQGKCDAGVVKKARPVTRNIELEMIVNGWAWVTRQYAFDREDEYFAAQEDAQRERRGLWAIGNPEPPWRFKRREKRRRLAAEQQASLFSRDP